MTTELVEQGVKYLAVSVGEATRGTALTRILALKGSAGWLVDGTELREWRFTGVTERRGTVYLYGPQASGISFESLLAMELAAALPFLARLARALVLLSARTVPWFPLQTDAVLFTAEGGVLFLPPAVVQEIRDLRTFESNKDSFEAFSHPDLKNEARASFALGSALYRIITGRFPIGGRDAEEVHEQARKLEITPPARIVPELVPEVSTLVMAGLGRARQGQPSLDDWVRALDRWQHQELFRSLTHEEKEKALRESGAEQEGSARGFRRRMFWEKNWRIVGIVAGVTAVVGIILGTMLGNVFKPRVTRGYAPQKVVETFYKSMNSLDHMTMEACVIGKAGQGEINEVTTLYVTSRVVMGYEGRSNIESASDWDAQGRPNLVAVTLYGVTGLKIVQEQPEPAPVFLVTYDKWNPAQVPDTGQMPQVAQTPSSEGHAVTDRVSLKQDRGDWVISRIDRLRADLLPAPVTVAAPTPSKSSSLNMFNGQ